MRSHQRRPIELERLRYRHGQTLRAREFNDQATLEAQYRAWHNRAMHDAYGLVPPFPLIAPGRGVVTVAPFLAYDYFGRELVSCCNVPVRLPNPTPAPAASKWLLARYPKEVRTCGQPPEPLPINCFPPCAAPEFCWADMWRFTPDMGIPVAAMKADRTLDLTKSPPFRSRRIGLPRIGNGQECTTLDEWKCIEIEQINQVTGTAVITESIDFHADLEITPPCSCACDSHCFAWLASPRDYIFGKAKLTIFDDGVIRCTCGSLTYRIRFRVEAIDGALNEMLRTSLQHSSTSGETPEPPRGKSESDPGRIVLAEVLPDWPEVCVCWMCISCHSPEPFCCPKPFQCCSCLTQEKHDTH